MIYHGNRFTLRKGVSDQDRDAALESLRHQGRTIPAVQSYTVGPDFGGEYEYGAVFVLEDLAGYEQYMNHPAHLHTDRIGLPLVDLFVSFDITDDAAPDVGAKIADIHRRRYEALPDIAALVCALGKYTGSAAPGPTMPGAAPGTAQ